MAEGDIALLAHLARRAGFGATRDELEEYASKGYDEVVEDLLHPEGFPEVESDLVGRYYLGTILDGGIEIESQSWFYRMVNSKRPLQEKIALFWHHVFATAWYKSEQNPDMVRQIWMLRRVGLSHLRTILTELSRDPMMIDWLDNQENHREERNENYGRELLELFSMGVGNYSEDDIKNAASAFSGWSFIQPIPGYPYGQHSTSFVYREEDHDDGVKSFLGEEGRFNGEDIIDIVVKQPATARFIARHLYNFFVADEPQVPAWNETGPQDPEAIDTLVDAYVESDGEIRSILRVLFKSDFFKEALSMRVKCPAELIAGTIKLAGTHRFPEPGLEVLSGASRQMGQHLLNPPSVGGWQTGREWIDGGALVERVNFAVDQLADASKPGVQEIIRRLRSEGDTLSPRELVDRCLDLVGPLRVSDATYDSLVRNARKGGDVHFNGESEETSARVVRMLQLIVASREYQFA